MKVCMIGASGKLGKYMMQHALEHAPEGARLIFSCGWHISRDGKDVYLLKLRLFVRAFGALARLFRFADLRDQVEACRRIFESDTRWAVVRSSDLEEGPSEGLPIWRRHAGDPALASSLTRRVDFALFMVDALTNDDLVGTHRQSSAASRRRRWLPGPDPQQTSDDSQSSATPKPRIMPLRRVSEHVKAQDWPAVGIDIQANSSTRSRQGAVIPGVPQTTHPEQYDA